MTMLCHVLNVYRIGQGIDFHRLERNPERPLILGGHALESDYALTGHSDADILLHAIADALLGAVAMGDIGDHFPDTNIANKNIDSRVILNKALAFIIDKGFTPINLDCTIIAEKPKIAPHRESIRKSIASLLNLSLDAVSVKATTTEKMGFIGREEGIEAMVIVLLGHSPT